MKKKYISKAEMAELQKICDANRMVSISGYTTHEEQKEMLETALKRASDIDRIVFYTKSGPVEFVAKKEPKE